MMAAGTALRLPFSRQIPRRVANLLDQPFPLSPLGVVPVRLQLLVLLHLLVPRDELGRLARLRPFRHPLSLFPLQCGLLQAQPLP